MIFIFMLVIVIAILVKAWFNVKVALYILIVFMEEQHYRLPGRDEMARLQKYVVANMLNDIFHRK